MATNIDLYDLYELHDELESYLISVVDSNYVGDIESPAEISDFLDRTEPIAYSLYEELTEYLERGPELYRIIKTFLDWTHR